ATRWLSRPAGLAHLVHIDPRGGVGVRFLFRHRDGACLVRPLLPRNHHRPRLAVVRTRLGLAGRTRWVLRIRVTRAGPVVLAAFRCGTGFRTVRDYTAGRRLPVTRLLGSTARINPVGGPRRIVFPGDRRRRILRTDLAAPRTCLRLRSSYVPRALFAVGLFRRTPGTAELGLVSAVRFAGTFPLCRSGRILPVTALLRGIAVATGRDAGNCARLTGIGRRPRGALRH